MQYKRDHAGNLLETSGCHAGSLDVLRAVFANVFKNHESVNQLKRIVLPGTSDLFISFDCPLRRLEVQPDFDTVCICELCPAGARHVSGILSLDIKRHHFRQRASLFPFGSPLRRQTLQLDQADHPHLSCNGRIRQWLSSVCYHSESPATVDSGEEVEMSESIDNWSIIDDPDEELLQLDFSEYYALIVLCQNGRQPPLQFSERPSSQSSANQVAAVVHQVTSLFDQRLRSVAPKGDRWCPEGRQFFLQKIKFFVLRGRPVACCLPAFPCKSSNPDKVASQSPDGAEYEALANLFRFCNEVKQVYKPGCRIMIVSDGHVFSDCIGVDDIQVSLYTKKLHRMCKRISSQFTSMSGLVSPISFKNLHNLFLDDRALSPLFQESYISTYQLKHFISTELNVQDEKCRKLLMLSAQSDANNILACIRSNSENSLTSLFCGFSKFMFEDLARHPATKHLSKSQRKKLSEKIAFEMIQRNQAYSHLVEQIFPHFVRFSIHAHRNSGPKFGIKLLPTDSFEHLTSFSQLDTNDVLGVGDAESERKHLHIPTPWHNCLLEVKGSPHSYVCKTAVVRDELSSPESKWEGGYFPSSRGERWMVALKNRKQERKERKRRIRQQQQIKMLEHREKENEQIEQVRLQIQLQEQIQRQREEELARKQDEIWSNALDEIDLSIAQGAELSDSSMLTDEAGNGVLPEWMDDFLECTSLDFDLWKHVEEESGSEAWIQVPFNEVQMDSAVKGNSVRENMYTVTHAYPEYQGMAVGTIPGTPFMGSNWLEVPVPLTRSKSRSARNISSRSRSHTNPSDFDSNQPGPRDLERVFNNAMATYERDIGRLSIFASEVKAGCRQEVANGTSHNQEYVGHINTTAIKKKFAMGEHQVIQSACPLVSIKANSGQERTAMPLPAPCPEIEEAWQCGDVAEAIISSYSTSPTDDDVWQ